MKHIKPYKIFENNIYYGHASSSLNPLAHRIINNFKNSDIDDIVLPIIDSNLSIQIYPVHIIYRYEDGFSPKGDYVVINILADNKSINYLSIKDDIEFLIKYINNMGYQTHIYAYDAPKYIFRNISFAEDNRVGQIDIYVTKK